MTLIDCVKALLARDDADSIRLDDGATTWDLDNLYDAAINSEDYDESVEYSVQADGIYALGDDGYLVSPPAYRIKGPHGGRRPGAGRKPGVRSPRKKEARQVTLAPGLWERIDTAQAERGLTRTAAFEEMALDWLAKRVARGLTPPREKA